MINRRSILQKRTAPSIQSLGSGEMHHLRVLWPHTQEFVFQLCTARKLHLATRRTQQTKKPSHKETHVNGRRVGREETERTNERTALQDVDDWMVGNMAHSHNAEQQVPFCHGPCGVQKPPGGWVSGCFESARNKPKHLNTMHTQRAVAPTQKLQFV